MAKDELGVNPEYQIPDELWERMESMLPSPKPKKKAGRSVARRRTGYFQARLIPRSRAPFELWVFLGSWGEDTIGDERHEASNSYLTVSYKIRFAT